ncbi:drug resistance transporter, EmrB/QacA subfamily [Paenibacillus catalpae]|uniref:Drug resistance transporter, EmrB/QacA subfamily n=1 Tax=Paenibacillus catalpae TaxID=1045775 RepID=A0A1I1UKR7_9BACL|nr:MDR family MFS transporter [Paenibacillus catalpae]SFD71175.1 drug resistance transporter, EmrB/QacA subfamily [Paenibacillus catalpae]
MSTTSNRRTVTIALYVATFLAAIEGTIVSTAMPSITDELHGIQQYSWIISIYLLATVITTPIYGKLSDLFGRKKMFIVGACIFLAGSMLSGLATSMPQLIAFRAIQGLGAGALTTIPYTIIGDLYPFEQRAKVQGWMSSIWGIAGITGPLAGGLLVDYVSWRAIFYMNLPFGIVALVLLITSMKEASKKQKRYIDYPGIGAFSLGMFAFLYALTILREPDAAASSAEIILLLAAAAVLLTLFFYIEKRSPEPIIPLQLFKLRMISTVNMISFLLCIINVVAIFYLPLWIQGVLGESATYSGIAMIPLSIGWPLGAILAGNFIAKFGMRKIAFIGSLFLIAGSVGFMVMTAHTSIVLLMIYTFLSGLSFGLSLTSFTVAVTSAVTWELRGAAVGSNNFIRTLGQTVGIALFGLMLNTGSTEAIDAFKLEHSLHRIFIILGVLSVLVLLAMLLLPKAVAQDSHAASDTADASS